MAKSVRDAFAELLARIEPRASEVDARRRHAKTIEQALAQEFPEFKRLEVIGSHTRDTAIHIHSDVDYLARIPRAEVTWGDSLVQPRTILDRVRGAIDSRLRATNVRVRGPAVVVEFGQGSGAVDVVPGFYMGPVSDKVGYPMFGIPDGTTGWLTTSPQRHGKYITDEDSHAGGKLRGTVKLLKTWKHARESEIPFLGFHVELLLASKGTCVGVKSYADCLLDAFRLLRDRRGSDLNDPLQISSRVPIVYTTAQADALVNAAGSGAERATRALDAERDGDMDEAFRLWNIIFNGQFPAR